MKGIITADVVGSTKIPQNQRGMLPEVLQQLVAQLQSICPLRLEIYRGDSFQIVVEQYEKSPLIAALIRVGMISKSIFGKYYQTEIVQQCLVTEQIISMSGCSHTSRLRNCYGEDTASI